MFTAFRERGVALGMSAVTVVIGLVGCTNSPSSSESASESPAASSTETLPRVVATSSVLCDLTKQIAEETVQLTCLMPAGQDPHVYAPAPSDRRAIEEADLLLYGGYGYEPSLVKMIDATTSGASKVAVYEEAVPNPILGESHDHDHAHDEAESGHAEEDDHGHEEAEATGSASETPDPHVWHDAQNGVAIAQVIQAHLAEIAPEHRDRYAENAEAIATELQAIDTWITAQVNTIPASDRKLVTTHDSFQYYAGAYGFEVAGALAGLSTEEKPSAARLTELVDLVAASQVKAIFGEITTNPQLIETVAKNAGVAVAEQPLFVEGPGGKGTAAETYQQMLEVNTCAIVNALGGQCDVDSAP